MQSTLFKEMQIPHATMWLIYFINLSIAILEMFLDLGDVEQILLQSIINLMNLNCENVDTYPLNLEVFFLQQCCRIKFKAGWP